MNQVVGLTEVAGMSRTLRRFCQYFETDECYTDTYTRSFTWVTMFILEEKVYIYKYLLTFKIYLYF